MPRQAPNAPRRGGAQNYPGKPTSAPKKKLRPVKVIALRTGYYDHARRREGDVFMADESDLEPRGGKDGKDKRPRSSWFERTDPNTPESVSTSQNEIDRQHDEILAAKAAKPTGSDEPGL